jgi:hypothetical protein
MSFGVQALPRLEDFVFQPRPYCGSPAFPIHHQLWKLLGNTVRESTAGLAGHQRSSITTLDSCNPGAWTTAGKLFMPSLPVVDKYKPEYYRLDTSYKELKNEEALAKNTLSVLGYCEMALYGISEKLEQSNIELTEETTQLCASLHVGLRHAIALLCKSSANAVLKRRDFVIADGKSEIRLPQVTGALRSAPLVESFLFQDSLKEAIKVQKTVDSIPA